MIAPQPTPASPALIGLDWGSTALRAYLFGHDGRVLQQRKGDNGILQVQDRDFVRALTGIVGDWHPPGKPLPTIACGMIGSTEGWREVPYVACPAGAEELVQALRAQETDAGSSLRIVPGLDVGGELPDVMRGEETQVLGALELRRALASGCRLVLPGTHCKWVDVKDSRIVSFRTYMTGEVFAVLRDHSILGRPARAAGTLAQVQAQRAVGPDFERGVAAAKAAGTGGLARRLFSARTLVLAGQIAADASLDYLSGLLIGDEIGSGLMDIDTGGDHTLALIGEAAICALYARAFALFNRHDVELIEAATTAGLWRLAVGARLVGGDGAATREGPDT